MMKRTEGAVPFTFLLALPALLFLLALIGIALARGDESRNVGPGEAQALIRENAVNRSTRALGIMGELGFRNTYHLGGGIKRWAEEGLSTVR